MMKTLRIPADLDDGGILHFHDWRVPPEEEVLATKLVLEHREPWLRNEATALGGMFTDVFGNPWGDGSDGMPDSSFTASFGRSLMGSMLLQARAKLEGTSAETLRARAWEVLARAARGGCDG